MSQFIFKPNTENLKNALAAVVERAISSIKRFATALHNKCNLVVYIDGFGRTCCQFVKKDAFSGYHFEFSGSSCVITNKETGEMYKAVYSPDFKFCSCAAFKFSSLPKQCKHLRMVAELRVPASFPGGLDDPEAIAAGNLEQAIEKVEPEQRIKSEINPAEVPTGCCLERSDDWISLEYYVRAWGYENRRGVRSLVQKNIGRLVQCSDGIHAYRVRSGVGHTFETTHDALAYLVRIVGTSFKEIAQAYELHENLVTKRISKL